MPEFLYWLSFFFGVVLGGCIVALFAGGRISELEHEIRGWIKLVELTGASNQDTKS